MNYGAGAVIIIGGVMLIIGIKGSQSSVWKTFTGNDITPAGGGFIHGKIAGEIPKPVDTNPTINSPYKDVAYKDAVLNNIDPTFFVRQIQQESGFNPSATSSAGAQGIAQFMPSTAYGLGVDPWNPISALMGAAKLMGNYIRTYGSEDAGLAAYNAGPGAYQSAFDRGGANWKQYLPQETQTYIHTITGG